MFSFKKYINNLYIYQYINNIIFHTFISNLIFSVLNVSYVLLYIMLHSIAI